MVPKKDEEVLKYHGVVLGKSDLDILRGPFYLNDSIIEFYFRYISSCYQSNDILIVTPTISFWLANCQDSESLENFVQPLSLHNKQLIIFTVNDNDDVSEADGGVHWSLLVYFRKSNLFVHHDSLGDINSDHAMKLYDAVKGFVGSGDANADIIFSLINGKKKRKKNLLATIIKIVDSIPSFEEAASTPRQTNSYDCGLYVMAIARVICQWYLGLSRYDVDDDLWFSAVKEHVNVSVQLTMRSELLDLIEELRDN